MSKESDYSIYIYIYLLYILISDTCCVCEKRSVVCLVETERAGRQTLTTLFIYFTFEGTRTVSLHIWAHLRGNQAESQDKHKHGRSSQELSFLLSFSRSFVLSFFRSLSAGQVGSWRLCSSQFSHCCLPVGKYGSFSSPLTSLTLESPCVSVMTGAEWGSEHTLSACMQIMLLLRGALNWILSAIKILFPEHSSWCITCKEHLH